MSRRAIKKLCGTRGAVAVDEHLLVAGAIALDDARIFLGQVERVGQSRRRENVECLLREGIHAGHLAARIGGAAKAIEAGQQSLAIAQLVVRDAVQNHVGPAGAERAERIARQPEKAGAGLVVRRMRGGVALADEGRHALFGRALQPRDDRAELWPTAGRHVLFGMPAGIALRGVVIVLRTDDRAHWHEFVHHPGQARQVLADFNARHVGANGAKRTGDLAGSVGLEIQNVLMRRPANQIDQHDRLVRAAAAGPSVSSQQLRQRQSSQT